MAIETQSLAHTDTPAAQAVAYLFNTSVVLDHTEPCTTTGLTFTFTSSGSVCVRVRARACVCARARVRVCALAYTHMCAPLSTSVRPSVEGGRGGRIRPGSIGGPARRPHRWRTAG